MQYVLLEEKEVGNVLERAYQVTKKKGFITNQEIGLIIDTWAEDHDTTKFNVPIVRVLGADWFTITRNNAKFNEYFESKVKDATKFYEFEKAIIYVHTPLHISTRKPKKEKLK
jgi:tRNA G10  N-methylase Trm11